MIEAGLGGRYDATNVLGAEVVVLTNVGLEHTRWLGPTIADIAGEKLAVVAPGSTLVLGETAPEVVALAEATGATDRPPGARRRGPARLPADELRGRPRRRRGDPRRAPATRRSRPAWRCPAGSRSSTTSR